MGTEIERKFLIKDPKWRPDTPGIHLRQGYILGDAEKVLRIRLMGDEAILCLKAQLKGIERLEYEYPIPLDEATEMLDRLCQPPLIEKTRHKIPYEGNVWEIDVFAGENEGLIVAEVELDSADQEVKLPPFVGKEVSEDQRYFNASLARTPYSQWKD